MLLVQVPAPELVVVLVVGVAPVHGRVPVADEPRRRADHRVVARGATTMRSLAAFTTARAAPHDLIRAVALRLHAPMTSIRSSEWSVQIA